MSHERCTYAPVIFEHQLLTCNWSFLDLDMPFSLALTCPNDQPPPGSCLLKLVLMSLPSGGLPHSVMFRDPTLHSNPFLNLSHLTLLWIVPWTHPGCVRHVYGGVVPSMKVNMCLIGHSSVAGCCHGVEAEAASSEQTISLEGMSPFRTSVAGLKTQPYDTSGPISKDIFHPNE